ncbi:MAG: enoyl-CoA hydratase/isomerase family protein [Alphaproteobacteria bacterium]
MSYETIRTEVKGAVGIVTLNRPDSLNAFTGQMRKDFVAAAAEMENNPEVRAVILTGEGRAFSAGADLKETSGLRDKSVERVLVEEYKPGIMAITESNKPWIAAVSGPASGIGAAFAQACDLMIMGEGAYIYMAFAAIALVPDGGNSWQLVRQLGYRRAFQAIAEGQKIPAATCVDWGLANRMVADEALQEEALAWGAQMAAAAPLALRNVKKILRAAMESDLSSVINDEAVRQNECITSKDFAEGVGAFFQKRPPDFKGQ